MEHANLRHEEAGFVAEAKEYLITLEGLPSIRINDVIINDRGNRAIVIGLRDDRVEALLLDRVDLRVGDRFTFKERGIRFPLGAPLEGRIINPVGDTLDGKGSLPVSESFFKLEVVAPSMNARSPIKRQFTTGVIIADMLLPLSFGQRQLVIGPPGSGKTLFLENVIINQSQSTTVCIYAFIGKPVRYVEEVVSRLLNPKGNPQTIIIGALSEETAPMIFISPSVAFSVAEHYASEGKDVLLVLDDLGTHAKYLREIALLAGRFPGRESYPGDIFYQHAHLMERAGQFNKTVGNGSITLLPVLETSLDDLTNLISTNLMAATDGYLLFLRDLYARGYNPSISVLQSVTRIGRKTQTQLHKELSMKILALLVDHEKQQEFSRFGAQLSEDTRKTLQRGAYITELLKQELWEPMPLHVQALLLALPFTPIFLDKEVSFVEVNKPAIIKALISHPQLSELRKSSERGAISLNEFIKRLIRALPIIEAVCRH